MNKRNMRTQLVPLKDGKGLKAIHHTKDVPNGYFKSFWNELNKSPKPNSKRQQKLKAMQALTAAKL
jgi:hypothetical protein